MGVDVTPRGTRGGTFKRLPGPLMQLANDAVFWLMRHRSLRGNHLLSLTTVGARSGRERRSTVMYFADATESADGDNAWLIVASAGGAASHPAWFFNLARHPDQVRIQIGNRRIAVTARTLEGAERAQAWQRITTQAPQFASYEAKTDRQIPVIRLTPAH
jgi:deazaflavin-dependent oxidoreductase (nitroreductase family)